MGHLLTVAALVWWAALLAGAVGMLRQGVYELREYHDYVKGGAWTLIGGGLAAVATAQLVGLATRLLGA